MHIPMLPIAVVLSCSLSLAVAQEPPAEKPAEKNEKPAEETKPPALAKTAPDGYVPYEAQDLRAMFETKKDADGKTRASVRIEQLRKFVERLGAYARNYPPSFRSPAEKELAVKDTTRASKVLATMLAAAKPEAKLPVNLLLAAGELEAIAHNLDVAGADERATAFYERLLKQEPDHALGNLHFGMFLAGTATRGKDAIPFLEKAAKLDQDEALRGLGICWLTLGDKAKALENLRAYAAKHPDDSDTANLIAAIESGRTEKVETKPDEKAVGKPREKPAEKMDPR